MDMSIKLQVNKNISNEQVLTDIRNIASKLNKDYITMDEYDRNNGFFRSTGILKRFGSWVIAAENAGLDTSKAKKMNIPKDELIEDIQKTARKLNKKSLLRKEYKEHGSFSSCSITRKFGSWDMALINAELEIPDRTPIREKKLSDDELLSDIRDTAKKLGKKTISLSDYDFNGKLSIQTIRKRFGSWNNALEKARLEVSFKIISEDELLEDIRDVANRIIKNRHQGKSKSISRRDYDKFGKFESTIVRKKFGSWENALIKAGLEKNEISDNELIEDLRAVASQLDKDFFIMKEYDQLGKFASATIQKRFGTWGAALQKAGLDKNRIARRKNIPDDELFDNLREVWEKLGCQPKYHDLNKKSLSLFSGTTYGNRFGSLNGTLLRFHKWLNDDSDNKYMLEDVTKSETKQNTGKKTIYKAIKIDRQPSNEPKITKRTSRYPTKKQRHRILIRDNFTCQWCGKNKANTPDFLIHIDHIVPYSKGGETVDGNLRVLCSDCNIGRSDTVNYKDGMII